MRVPARSARRGRNRGSRRNADNLSLGKGNRVDVPRARVSAADPRRRRRRQGGCRDRVSVSVSPALRRGRGKAAPRRRLFGFPTSVEEGDSRDYKDELTCAKYKLSTIHGGPR